MPKTILNKLQIVNHHSLILQIIFLGVSNEVLVKKPRFVCTFNRTIAIYSTIHKYFKSIKYF